MFCVLLSVLFLQTKPCRWKRLHVTLHESAVLSVSVWGIMFWLWAVIICHVDSEWILHTVHISFIYIAPKHKKHLPRGALRRMQKLNSKQAFNAEVQRLTQSKQEVRQLPWYNGRWEVKSGNNRKMKGKPRLKQDRMQKGTKSNPEVYSN